MSDFSRRPGRGLIFQQIGERGALSCSGMDLKADVDLIGELLAKAPAARDKEPILRQLSEVSGAPGVGSA